MSAPNKVMSFQERLQAQKLAQTSSSRSFDALLWSNIPRAKTSIEAKVQSWGASSSSMAPVEAPKPFSPEGTPLLGFIGSLSKPAAAPGGAQASTEATAKPSAAAAAARVVEPAVAPEAPAPVLAAEPDVPEPEAPADVPAQVLASTPEPKAKAETRKAAGPAETTPRRRRTLVHAPEPEPPRRRESKSQSSPQHKEPAVTPQKVSKPQELTPKTAEKTRKRPLEPETPKELSGQRAAQSVVKLEVPLGNIASSEPATADAQRLSRPRRVSVPPLQHWRNESVVYKREPGSPAPTVAGFVYNVADQSRHQELASFVQEAPKAAATPMATQPRVKVAKTTSRPVSTVSEGLVGSHHRSWLVSLLPDSSDETLQLEAEPRHLMIWCLEGSMHCTVNAPGPQVFALRKGDASSHKSDQKMVVKFSAVTEKAVARVVQVRGC